MVSGTNGWLEMIVPSGLAAKTITGRLLAVSGIASASRVWFMGSIGFPDPENVSWINRALVISAIMDSLVSASWVTPT